MRHRSKAAKIAVGALFALGVIALILPFAANSQSRSRLNRELSRAKDRAATTKKGLTVKRQRAAKARNHLVEAQQQLAAAEARLRRARERLETTRRELAAVKEELEQTKKRLAQHQAAMQERLLALFRSEDPSYVEVLLHATSFDDFANRAHFTRLIAQRDESVLLSIVEDKRKVEAQQRLLEVKEAEEAALKEKIAKERVTVAGKAAEAKKLAHSAQTDMKQAEAQLAAQQAEARSIGAMLRRLGRSTTSRYRHYGSWSGSLARPVPGRISSGYGWRIHPITHTRRWHNGIDIACSGGTPIACSASGTVVSTGWRGAYGLTVIVDHGSGMSTMYGHCQRGSIRVSAGQKVSRGQILARVDSTGWSTGNHLHWTVFRNGKDVNPFSV